MPALPSSNYYLARFRLGLRLLPRRWRWLLTSRTVGEIAFSLADLLLVFDLYELLSNRFTPRLRSLTERERYLLHTIFGDSVPYGLIRIDERAHLGPRRYRFCYVGFLTVNSWGPMAEPTLVHEIVHVWQYVHRGAAYIPRALRAQRSTAKYDYGGVAGLRAARRLEDFNYEQMADVVEDGFRLANAYRGQWTGGRGAELLPHFYPFLEELRAAALPDPHRD